MKFISTLVFLTFLSSVAARINIAPPVNAIPGGRYTVTWTHDASDPSEFILMIQLNTHTWATGQFWEFTQTTDGKLDVVFENASPNITPDGLFRLQARNQSNVDQIYSESEQFRFLAAGSTPPPPPPPSSCSISSGAPSSSIISSASGSSASGVTSSLAASSSVAASSSASTRSSGASSSSAGPSQTATPSQSAGATPGAASNDDQVDEGAAMVLTRAAIWTTIAAFVTASWTVLV